MASFPPIISIPTLCPRPFVTLLSLRAGWPDSHHFFANILAGLVRLAFVIRSLEWDLSRSPPFAVIECALLICVCKSPVELGASLMCVCELLVGLGVALLGC